MEFVRYFVDQGADVNTKNLNGTSALHFACNVDRDLYSEHLEVVTHLITEGADVNGRNGNGSTALHFASSNGK